KLMSLYILCLTIPNCDYRLFEKITLANLRFYEINLIERQLEVIISPTHNKTNKRELKARKQVANWHDNNQNLVDHCSGPTGCFILSNSDILGSDVFVILID
ncbi:35308_t:CDS:2, partial [Racocetra persica]